MSESIHLNLDDAWGDSARAIACCDARAWGPRLRYLASPRFMEEFFSEVVRGLPPFVLYGSGDFHHVSALLMRKVERPFTLVSFDNHPDWDIRPPRWTCGGWINHALELPNVRHAAVWGCGNFELTFPSRLFANRRALRGGRLDIYGWAERYGPAVLQRFHAITRENWRVRFEEFARQLAGGDIYVTIDIDCICAEQAATNWENGLFTAEDIAWALGRLREAAALVGGDLCGAYSPPVLARWPQRLASWWDHPKLPSVSFGDARARNAALLGVVWPALTG